MKHGRRFNLLAFGGIVFALLASLAVNTTVDPWRVTPAPWSAKSLEPYRDLSNQIRTGKAGLIRSGEWDVGMLGSSRVENAWNPAAAGWDGQRAVNLGASGGAIHETLGIGRYFLEHEPAELIVIGIDPGDLTSPTDTRPMSDFYNSPFSPDGRLDDEIRYLFGLSTLEASLKVLGRARKGRTAEYTPEGLRLRPESADTRSQMKFIRGQLVRGTEDPEGPLDPEKTAMLRDFLAECAARSRRVVLVFHPVHALLYARAADLEDPPVPFESTRRFLLEVTEETNRLHPSREWVRYWDFCNFHPLHVEALPADKDGAERMKHWDDLGHYNLELGESLLGIALGWPATRPEWEDRGTRITAESIGPYLESLRDGYREYLDGPGAADVAWKESLLAPRPAD